MPRAEFGPVLVRHRDDLRAPGWLWRIGRGLAHAMAWSARWISGLLPGFKTESLWPELLAIGGFLLLPWIGIGMALHHEYYDVEAAAVQSTANLAQALEESTRRTVGEIDTILLSARAMRAAQGEGFSLRDWVSSQTLPDRMTTQIATADGMGRVDASTGVLQPGITVADRPHFRAQLNPDRDALFISEPVVGRVSGVETIQFSRKLLDLDGGFAGVIVLSLSNDELSRFYDSVKLGKGFVSILSTEGVILARGPRSAGLAGSIASGAALSGGVLHRLSGSLQLPATAVRGAQIASFRRLRDYPVIVMIGFDTESVFEPYRSLRTNLLLSGAAITLAVGLIGFFWVRQKQHSLASRRALTVTLETITQGILMVDRHGAVSVINPPVLGLLGRAEDLPDRALRFVAARAGALIAQQSARDETRGAMVPVAAGAARRERFETTLDTGAVIEVRTHSLPDGGFVQTYTDITEQRLAHAQVSHLAHHDALTGLANRAALMRALAAVVEQRSGMEHQTALVMIDLDGFKGVNDTRGHHAGDLLLIEVAQRLRGLVRAADVVARLGGDEFVVVLPGLAQREVIVAMMQRVLRRLADPVMIEGHCVRIGASLGIAFHPQDGPDVDTWLRHADIALYSAKNGGRGTYRCFDEQLAQALTKQQGLERDLRQALDDDALEVYFQPKFNCGSLEITGFEALARWRHPTMGAVSPAVFIGIAETSGLINRLGLWVLQRACACVATWEPRHPVAVNVSVIQLRDTGLKDQIAAVLMQTGLPPESLEIEVTESVMADEDETVLENLRAIKAMGLRISLDDFGTGYSSLSYLRRFSFDKIKIDRSFVQGQADDPGMRIILESILGLCHGLGLSTIGEGVETPAQLALLRDRGCTEVQGFLLGRPMPQDQVQDFIRSKGRPADVAAPAGPEAESRQETALSVS
jgi:diguanylate cyclase (GGDEF)-like protein